MAHIELNNDFPGIRGLMAFRPETAATLNDLAEVLLRSENTLSKGERELIGAYVSGLNQCNFCNQVHSSLAQHYLECAPDYIDHVLADFSQTDLSVKMKSLLSIAGAVAKSGRAVTAEIIAQAKENGATDQEIHDTVLIAAAFCMFNRYVDGLATRAPEDKQYYINRAAQRAAEGYSNYNPAE